MNAENESLQELQHIKRMMERSSRFISLSGLSGISAGVCALAGAWFANKVIMRSGGPSGNLRVRTNYDGTTLKEFMGSSLFEIAAATFVGAIVLSFLFAWLRSKKSNIPLWGTTARRLM